MSTTSTWKKVTPFGDYNDPEQNHKVYHSHHQDLVNRVRKLYYRHPGSKSMHTLLMYR